MGSLLVEIGIGIEIDSRSPDSRPDSDSDFDLENFIKLDSLHFRHAPYQTCERLGPFQFLPDQDV